MRILIIEDEVTLSKMLKEGLKLSGFQCDSVENLREGEYYLNIRYYDLVLIDWILPDGNSNDFIKIIKESSPGTKVFILSSRDDNETEIEALNSGADDYIKKPFDFDILNARIQSKISISKNDIIEIGDLLINTKEKRVSYKGTEINLKGIDFEMLSYLANYYNKIVSKEQLLDALWELPELTLPTEVEQVINKIRKKIDKRLGITTIETIRGRGYRFCYTDKID